MMQMKQQCRASSGLDIPYGTRYPHLTYGFQSEVLLRPPQYQPIKTDFFARPLAQVLYKPTPTYHAPRAFLPVLHQGTSPPLQFPVYHEPQVGSIECNYNKKTFYSLWFLKYNMFFIVWSLEYNMDWHHLISMGRAQRHWIRDANLDEAFRN